ncbi:MAG: exodeoxyribonuclease V subunit gamma, partial [Chlamydiia bacterium]|nr:exodeoxyribonuclease V subunit gamma [Chlamydiia bacterium]
MFKKIKEFGIKKGGVLYSNALEVLFEHLKLRLFPEGCDPFTESLLIVPSLGMQQWIQRELADSLGIACGFKPVFLHQALEILRKRSFCEQRAPLIPTPFELALAIESEIRMIQESPEALWAPLITYIQGKEGRKWALVHHLAQLFEKYGLYAQGSAEHWEHQPEGWQQALWARVFKKWDYPHRIMTALYPNNVQQDTHVHLFAFSHLSPLHFQFFSRLSTHLPVHFYQLSPCQEFWSDLAGQDHPSLLGSMGKVGREMARLIEESDSEVEEAYLVFGGQTQLRRLQRDLLRLQVTEERVDDLSIQVHSLTTPHQEVENLYHILVNLFTHEGIEPKEVIVMAPQITHYTPYIQAIFEDKIPYQIADMPMEQTHPLLKGLMLMLNLERRRWSSLALLELVDYPLFAKKQGLTEKERLEIRAWMQKTGIRWAVDKEHRAALLKKGGCQKELKEGAATWMEG